MGRRTIPECPVAILMVPGNPAVLESLAGRLTLYAASSVDAAGRLRLLADPGEWDGPAAEGFVEQMSKLPKTLDKGTRHFTDAANALHAYAAVLRGAQSEVADRVIPAANDARARSAQWKADREAVEAGTLVLDLPDKDFGKDALHEAEEHYGRIHDRLKDAEETCWKAIDTSRREAPTGGDPITGAFTSLGAGVKESLQGLLTSLDTLSKLGPWVAVADWEVYKTNLQSIVGGYERAFNDPIGYAKDSVNWDEWRKDPWKALGLTAPDLVASLLTGGGSRAVPDAPTPNAGPPGVKTPDGKTPQESGKPGDPHGNKDGRPEDCRQTCSDPVDVATGDVVLPQTDVMLPGILRLVLQRQHVSSFRRGRWFGPSWASTLDQYLELRQDGIVYTSPTGMVLRYPVPSPGQEVLPASGPRWPLAWDGTPGGGFAILRPRDGVALHFTPLDRPKHSPSSPGTPRVLRAIYDRNLNRVEFHHDADGNPIEVEHSGGYRVLVDTADGRVRALRLLDPGAGTSHILVRYGYDEAGNLAAVVNSSDRAQRFTYDDAHRMTSWTDRNDTWFQYTYDTAGRCVRTDGSDGFLGGLFDYRPGLTRYTDSHGHTSEYAYNDRYQVIRETDPLGNTIHQGWDSYNNLVERTDACGGTTSIRYDPLGNPTHVTRPDGLTATTVYDPRSLPIEVTGPDGAHWTHEYDAHGNPTASTDPAGAVVRHDYHPTGGTAGVVDETGRVRHFECDPAGLSLAVTDASGATTRLTRDVFGRPVTVVDPLGNTSRLTWTPEGKPAWRQHPGGTSESWTWDGEGNLLAHRDQAGATTRYEYTHFDLPSARTTADGARHEFAYDTESRLARVTDPRGGTWSYVHDQAGRLTSETDFDGRTLTYRYDRAGRLVARVNGAGEEVAYTRDALGNVSRQVHVATARATDYTHDAYGRLTKAINTETELVLRRDAVGRVVTETCNGRRLSKTYDASGGRLSRTTPAGPTSVWSHDAVGRPAVLAGPDDPFLEFGYDDAGREIERRFGTRVRFRQEWSADSLLTTQAMTADAQVNRITAILEPGSGLPEAHRRAYTYRPDGLVTGVDDSALGAGVYGLDTLGRVVTVDAADWSERYAYDTSGNITYASWPGDDARAHGDRAIGGTIVRRAGRVAYAHDGQGRVVRRTHRTLSGKPRTWSYTWDADDRLTHVATPDGETWHYVYDGLARRVEKRRSTPDGVIAEVAHFTWDGNHLVEQTIGDATTTWEYLPGTHRPLTQSTTRNEEASRHYAVVTDLVGTPLRLVDLEGATVWRSRATLWGVMLGDGGPVDCPLRFPGQYHDVETGLHYNNQRYYDPLTARYQSADPFGITPAPNPFQYPRNPLNRIDPLGLFSCNTDPPKDSERTAGFVYRALAPGEDPAFGLTARNPNAVGTSPLSHVSGKIDSPWISTAKLPSVAFEKYNDGNGVVLIDLSKVPSYTDISAGFPGKGRADAYAKKDQEVLIYQHVPPDAIVGYWP